MQLRRHSKEETDGNKISPGRRKNMAYSQGPFPEGKVEENRGGTNFYTCWK